MSAATQIVNQLRQLGFYDIVLPWLFTFAIALPLLRAIFVVKKDDKKEPIKVVPELIALVIAFSAVYYTPWGQTVQGFFTELFGGSIMVLAGLFLLILMFSFVPGVRDFLDCPLAPLWALLSDEKVSKVVEECKKEGRKSSSFGLLLIGIGIVLTLSAWKKEIPVPYLSRQYAYFAGVFAIILAVIILFKQKPKKKDGGNPPTEGGDEGEEKG